MLQFCPAMNIVMCFNPRAREGRDFFFVHHVIELVSFNPRAREGRDIKGGLNWRYLKKFQSTRPRGRDISRQSASEVICCFNPRAREGRDKRCGESVPVDEVSIHAPARGATSLPCRNIKVN